MTLASAGTVTRPDPNGQMPAMARNSVDLPAPDGPVTSTRSPAVKHEVLGVDQRLAVGQADGEMVDRRSRRRRRAAATSIAGGVSAAARPASIALLEAGQAASTTARYSAIDR